VNVLWRSARSVSLLTVAIGAVSHGMRRLTAA
jgi:hypothetical protein